MISPGGLVATLFKASVTVSTAVDAFFGYVSLLLNGEGETPFSTDASSSNAQLSVVGAVRNDAFSPFRGGNYSVAFNGTADYITTANNAAFNIGTNSFSIEAWVFPTATQTNRCIIGQANVVSGNGSFLIFINASGFPALYVTTGGTAASRTDLVAASTLPLNQWSHVAACRSGSALSLFVNGTRVAAITYASAIFADAATNVHIAGDSNGASLFAGRLSNVRVVNGSSAYDATQTSITVPTSPLTAITNTILLACQSSRIVDSNTTAKVLTPSNIVTIKVSTSVPFAYTNTAGSGYFPGGTDYMTSPSIADLAFGTGDFTVEFWVYPNAAISNNGVFQISTTAGGFAAGAGLLVAIVGGKVQLDANGGNVYAGTQGTPPGVWSHIAVTRASGSTKVYVNGVYDGITVADTSIYAGTYIGIGGYYAVGYQINAYISNLRVVKGTAVYSGTGSFTPSATPLIAIGGTALLTLQNPGATTNQTFVDSSTNNANITKAGTPVPGTLSPFSQSGWSGYFNGTTDYLGIAANAAFGFASADFTMEAWVYPTVVTAGNNTIFEFRSSAGANVAGAVMYLNPSLQLALFNSPLNAAVIFTGTTLTLNKWNHVACVRSAGVAYGYVNGVLAGSGTYSSALGTSLPLYIGYNFTAGNNFYGYISNVRIVNGTAVYTSAFTPSTSALPAISGTSILTLQNNRFKDNSTNTFAITMAGTPSVQPISPFEPATSYVPSVNSGSVYFNKVGTYLTVPASTVFDIGTSNFTIEAWINLADVAGYKTIVSFSSDFRYGLVVNGNRLCAFVSSTGTTWNGMVGDSSGQSGYGAIALAANQWYHVALTRTGNVWNTYINGVRDLNVTLSITVTPTAGTTPLTIGNWGNNIDTYRFNGYISDYRFVKGTAVYTGAFTPPTAPLTAITNTQLLLNGTSSGIVDYAGKNDVQTLGSAQVTKSFYKFGSSSLKFNGTTDYLSVPSTSQAMQLGASNFTYEMWVNTNAIGTRQSLAYLNANATGYAALSFNILANGKLACSISETGAAWKVDDTTGVGTALVANTWYHVAVLRNNALINVYLNGVFAGSYALTAATTSLMTTYTLNQIGVYNTSSYFMNGYIDDLRLTKGIPRYLGNFTVPTQAFGDDSTSDPYFSSVSLLMHADGTAGAVNNAFVDSSANALVITKAGTPTQGTFSPFGQSGWSGYFSGTDYLTSASNAAFSFGTGDFTIEAWLKPTVAAGGNRMIFSTDGTNSSGVGLMYNALGTAFVYFGGSYYNGIAGAVKFNQWNHIAAVRSSGQIIIYVNGVAGSTIAFTGSNNSTRPWVGANPDSAGEATLGYISNLRVVKGTAVYTSAFTPSTTPLAAIAGTSLLALQSTRFKDSSSNNLTFALVGTPSIQPVSPFAVTSAYSAATNSGSMYFNGSTDNIVSTASAANNLGATASWTIEGWFYPTAYAAGNNVLITVGASAGDKVVIATIGTAGNLYYLLNGGVTIAGATSATLNVWNHYALSKNGTTTTLYLNGVSLGSVATGGPVSSSKTVSVGSDNYGTAAYFSGYQSNVRIVNGTAVYTAAFTPSTTPLTAVANTQLLLTGTNAGIINNASICDITLGGGAKIGSTAKFGSGALSLNGTTDYAYIPSSVANPNFAFGTGDFTIEMWVYINTTAAMDIFDFRPASTNGAYLYLGTTSGGGPYVYVNGSNAITGTTVIPVSTWTHIAVSRATGITRLFLNGAQTGLSFTDATAYTVAANRPYIGAAASTGVATFNGYIDDLRITKGVGRYAGGFTPPTAALPTR